MKYKSGVKVFAPATVGNIGIGFDLLGLAIHGPGDEIIIKEGNEKGLKITTIRNGRKLPKDINKNTASVAALAVLEKLGISDFSIEMEINKKMPLASGMGSSGTSAAAGAFGMNIYLGEPLSKRQLLPLAMQGEMLTSRSNNADNVAPSLLGGIVLTTYKEGSYNAVKLPIIEGLHIVVIRPHINIFTKESRSLLSENVSLNNAIEQTGNIAKFVAALYRKDIDLLSESLNDVLIEPQRAHKIPHFYEMKKQALKNNALGFSISGSGPSVFAICKNSIDADNVNDQIKKLISDQKIVCDSYISQINPEGAFLY